MVWALCHKDCSWPHGSFRLASCCHNVNNIPTTAKFKGISVLLLLRGGYFPISWSCHSVRNKGYTIADTVSSRSLDLLVITETHI